jgi:hypothetical protein
MFWWLWISTMTEPDVATAAGGGVAILLGKGDGTFGAPILLNSSGTYAIAADFNWDGNADIAVDFSGTGLGIYLGHGDGSFSAPRSVGVRITTPTLLAGGFNGDGIPDLLGLGLGADPAQMYSQILLGRGNGNFIVQQRQYLIDDGGLGAYLVAGDFNEDGKLDIASTGLGDAVWILVNATKP